MPLWDPIHFVSADTLKAPVIWSAPAACQLEASSLLAGVGDHPRHPALMAT
jgi:hypothetical protein